MLQQNDTFTILFIDKQKLKTSFIPSVKDKKTSLEQIAP